MFLNYLKDLTTKKIVKKSLSNARLLPAESPVRTVGILFDESYFYDREALVAEMVSNGIAESNISILVFKNKIRKNETFDYPVFSNKDLSWTGAIETPEVTSFTAKHFDLLIDYYDTDKSALLLVSHQSRALFKVGFASVDKRLHHFMIDTSAGNYKVFSDELFKYLKILNKL
ncbi:MAG: hypothetical protein EOO48_04370 [Flavobacterium sp.]|nr:MAG: hypothetical protein EOO48_04370 [Flavobacterium sp.]